jgi:hypothetical protein
MMDVKNLSDNLSYFTGTESYHLWSALFPHCVLTDGALFLAENAGAFWLMDIIGSYQRNPGVRNESLQVWKLTAQNNRGVVTCQDGEYRTMVRQEIPFTNFPLPEISLLVAQSDGCLVIMLPSEY